MRNHIRISPRAHPRGGGSNIPTSQKCQPTGGAKLNGNGPATGSGEGKAPTRAARRLNDPATKSLAASARTHTSLPWEVKRGAST